MSETKVSMIDKPQIGEIHMARIGIADLFGSECNFDANTGLSSSKSESSASSSSRKSEKRPRKGPTVIWKIHPTIQVLVMSRFSDVNVADSSVRLFNNLSHQYVIKRLVPVFPKPSYDGKRSIHVLAMNSGESVKTINTNLILIPVNIPKNWNYQKATEYLPVTELNYVNDLIRQINIDDSLEQAKAIQSIIYPPLPSQVNQDADQHDDNDSSLTSSSLPIARNEFLHGIDDGKDEFIGRWLDYVGHAHHEELSNISQNDGFTVDHQAIIDLDFI